MGQPSREVLVKLLIRQPTILLSSIDTVRTKVQALADVLQVRQEPWEQATTQLACLRAAAIAPHACVPAGGCDDAMPAAIRIDSPQLPCRCPWTVR
jgi:hypothetical protein